MREILLYGTVGFSFWGEEAFTPSDVAAALAVDPGPVRVRINSGGGVAADGHAIYSLLRDHAGGVEVLVDGIAASAASLIAMAGRRIEMRPGSLLMIHDPAQPWTEGRGTEDDHLRTAATMGMIAGAYAAVYAARTGHDLEHVRAVMRAETYYDGAAAVEAGFADAVVDGDTAAAAAFDYRIYGHPPAALLRAAGGLPRQRNRAAVMAMMAGGSAARGERQENRMTNESAAAGGTEITTEAGALELVDQIEPESETETAASAATLQGAAPASVALQVMDLCAALGRPIDEARALIAEGVTLAVAVDRITMAQQMESPMRETPTRGAPAARILRDERDTRRQGMTEALIAQMARQRDVDGSARGYMGMGLAEMAAATIDYRGGLRTAADRLRVVEMAMHTTGDFPSILENALSKRFMAAYQVAEPTYRRIATRLDFMDFRPHPVSQVSDFPAMQDVAEGGEIKFGTLGDKKETLQLVAKATALNISRQMIVNDDLGAIDRVLAGAGRAAARDEETWFYTMFLSGSSSDGPTLAETTRQVFNTTDGTKAASGAAISVTTLAAGRAAIQKHTGLRGEKLSISPSILLVGPDKLTEAEQVVAPLLPALTTSVNPFTGRLVPVSTAHITGNAWYLLADPATMPAFAYGFLSGEEGPRLRIEEPFGRQGVSVSLEQDFGCGAIDRRGVYKNAGA